MKVLKTLSFILLLLYVVLFSDKAEAQYIIEQFEYSIYITPQMMPADKRFANQTEEARYFLNQPDNKFSPDNERETGSYKITKSTIYLDGDNFAADNISSNGDKTSTITNANRGMFYLVSWPRKTVMEISTKDMEEIQKNAATSGKNSKKNLSPEADKETEKNEADTISQSDTAARFTGREINKNGFECKQYLVEQGDNIMMIWATDDNKGLSAHFESITKNMKALFPSDNDQEKDEWDLLPGKIPIEVKTFSRDMNGSHIDVQEIKKISNEKPRAERFIPPGKSQGFTTRSMKEMMMQMNDMSEDGTK